MKRRLGFQQSPLYTKVMSKLRRLPSAQWLQFRIVVAFSSLIPLFITASGSASWGAWRVLSGIGGHGSAHQDASARGLKKQELEAKIEQLCILSASSRERSPQPVNAAETFLRIRELAGGAGVAVSRFSGPEAVTPNAQELQVLMEVQGSLGEITDLFDSLIMLVETVDVLGWSIERTDQSAGSLRAVLHLARRPIKPSDECAR